MVSQESSLNAGSLDPKKLGSSGPAILVQPKLVESPARTGDTVDCVALNSTCSNGNLSNGAQGVAEKITEQFTFLESPQEPGELGWLAHYRVVRLVGQGGMGLVFLGEDQRLRRQVAIKVMRPELAESAVVRHRFLREARAVAAVRSDHITAIYEIGQVKDLPYYVTDFLQGKPLDVFLEDGPRPTPAQVVDIGLQIARGLEDAHRSGLIHRDIKPANIWVEEKNGRIKILDFGLSRYAEEDDGLTSCGTILGTPLYMAPEQAAGRPVDARCDLFSLGCVLYEAAAGKSAFDATSAASLVKATTVIDPPHLRDVAPSLPPAFCELVMRLLEKDPENRPASATVVVEFLTAIAGVPNSGVTARRSGARVAAPAVETTPSRRRFRWTIRPGVTGLCCVALGIVLALVISHFRRTMDSGDSSGWDTNKPSNGDLMHLSTVQGVNDEEILLGMSAPFSGTAKELGRELQTGIETYFRLVNAEGGIAGRKLKLIALDDGYQPDRALANMKDLDENHHVFAIMGNVGTPTAEKTVPYALAKKQIFFGAFTGAPLLRHEPPDRYIFNYRASYAEETAAIVKYLITVKGIRPEQIAVFAQQDGYGDAGFNGVAKILRQYNRRPEDTLRVGHERNSNKVGEAVKQILQHDEIRAVVMISTYGPATAFIQQLKDAKRELIFTNVSFVGSNALAEELHQLGPDYANGVIVTQVVPHPASYSSAVLKYREHLLKFFPNEQPSFVSLEGYFDAVILVEGLRRAGNNLTTETLVEALETIRGVDLGLGTPLQYGPSEHQASHKIWGSILDSAGRFQNLELE